MVNTNQDALGIIFPNSYDNQVPELVSERLMASIPFASRYRMIDFLLSSMVNCGIDNISVIVRKNYRSLMRHLGSGREWDLTRKNGGLNIVPPFAEKTVKVYNGRVEALASILEFLKVQREKYVVISDANIVANFDFNAMIDAHVASGADVTIAYKKEEIPYSFMNLQPTLTTDLYYTLEMDANSRRVNRIKTNPKD
ncbi:MAG: glucose-1-phosphate adenylyltransferase subunit GlgD, partial [Acetatifactor sp.]|nr:glucose-1-phosphate adenylyltransferase subunit GlgD [Acetatifactor sp.]